MKYCTDCRIWFSSQDGECPVCEGDAANARGQGSNDGFTNGGRRHA